jgi:hypothetical protein
MYLSLLAAGFGGGMVRGLLGFIKHQYSYKNVGFDLPYFFVMSFLSGIIGVLVAVAVASAGFNIQGVEYVSPGLAFIIGYAGGDFMESLYKIILEKFSLGKKK